LVWTTALGPYLRCGLPLAAGLQGKGMINIRQVDNPPGLSQPIGELGLQIQVPESHGFGKDRLSDVDHRRQVTSQGGVFAGGCGHRTNPL
jgi:hypothetical protein